MAAFREAIENPEIGIISLQADLTESNSNRMTVDCSLVIKKNGYTLSFNYNYAYFQLSNVNEATILRIENAIISKNGTRPFIEAVTNASLGWLIKIENVNESQNSRSR